MKDLINPVPETIAGEPDVFHRDLLDGVIADRESVGRRVVHSNSEKNSLERHRDDFRGRVFDETLPTTPKASQ